MTHLPKAKKRIRLKLVSLRLPIETLVVLDVFIANKNITEIETDRTRYVRKLVVDHTKDIGFQESVKNFKESYPEKYKAILEKYAKGV